MTDLIDNQVIWNLRPEWIPGQVDNTRDNIIKIDVKIPMRSIDGNKFEKVECDKARFPKIGRGELVLFSAKLVKAPANFLSDKDPDLVHRWQVDIDELREVKQQRDREEYDTIIKGFASSHAAKLDALVSDAETKIEEQATKLAEEKIKPQRASLAREWQEHATDRTKYDEDRNSLKVAFSALTTEQAFWDKEQQRIQNTRQELEDEQQKLEQDKIDFEQKGGAELLNLLRQSKNTDDEELVVLEDKETPPKLLSDLKKHFDTQNYFVENALLLQTMLCLCVGAATGQFVVLTGPPGSGKTSLVKKIAKAVGAGSGVVPVRPAWIDATDLIGFYNPNINRYQPTPFLDYILQAKRYSEKNRLFLLVLDEMNLGHVENYAADFLSLMEKAKEDNENSKLQLYSQEIESRLRAKIDALPPESRAEKAELLNHLNKYPSRMALPTGLVLFGTINVDETTHLPSPKFLDRSLTIQVSSTELSKLKSLDASKASVELSWALSLATAQKCMEAGKHLDKKAENSWNLLLKWNNDYFKPLGIRLSHRLPQVYCAYMGAATVLKLSDHQTVFETFVLSKIMPLISFRDGDKSEDLQKNKSENLPSKSKREILDLWQSDSTTFPLVRAALETMLSRPGMIIRYLE